MDFARRQLEKYGWSDGKGLGKHGNGISEAIKPKIKRSVTGIGHDPASEFNEHWWSALYDKAAKNVEVKDKNGKTKKIKTNTENFTITNSTWKINKKQNDATENEYSEYFIKKAILGNGGSKEEKVESDSEEEIDKKDVFMMTDEELFAACEGRTAHKGARHGLKAIGKLARIAEQEQKLITQSKYEGYSSHAKKLKQKIPEEIVENISLEDIKERKSKKKNKRKRCVSNENKGNIAEAESQTLVTPKSKKLKSKNCDDDISEIKNNDSGRKINSDEMNGASIMETDNNESFIKVKKNKKRKSNDTEIASEQICEQFIEESTIFKKKKKKKCKTEDASEFVILE